MAWQEILKVTLTLVGCFGGVGAITITVAVVRFTADKIAQRLEIRYELKINKELEEFKSKMQNKFYVSKTRFDAEFNIYR